MSEYFFAKLNVFVEIIFLIPHQKVGQKIYLAVKEWFIGVLKFFIIY